jgi:hypothetical protein
MKKTEVAREKEEKLGAARFVARLAGLDVRRAGAFEVVEASGKVLFGGFKTEFAAWMRAADHVQGKDSLPADTDSLFDEALSKLPK